ncbi:uncharacterized protein BP5553_07609 [Venustampulla echinocandica]|uniref:Retrotransposon gag domain-containing protein n=1 Tax=Venustampulla echinocandica TaxID=2656787 RepID=A0A370TH09_9HELO|nr:uncharacterized protein BP5553_07609 [Venustampulla echinocandica]RDL34481.1 hypothetical protein BP5553_07609 [Venustampulla echinocandica]
MLAPGMLGALYFEGVNVTEFLERYGDQCEDANLKEGEKLKRLLRYCSIAIGQYVKAMAEWKRGVWEILENVLMEEFKDQDSFQQMNSRSFLEALKSKKRTSEDDVRQFIRQFTAISTVLVNKKELEEYTRGIWFLNGLLEDVRGKVIRRGKVTMNKPETVKFSEMAKTATEIYTSNKSIREFADSKVKQDGLSELVDRLGEASVPPRPENILAALVVASRVRLSKEVMDNLSNMFKAIALSARATAEADMMGGAMAGGGRAARFNPPSGGNQAAAYPAGLAGRINAAELPRGGQAGWYLQQMPAAAVNAAMAARSKPIYCFYYLESGHFRRECDDFRGDEGRGFAYERPDGLLYYGRRGDGGASVPWQRGERGRDTVRQVWGGASAAAEPPKQVSGMPRQDARPAAAPRKVPRAPSANVSSMSVVDLESSDVEEGDSDGFVIVAGVQGRQTDRAEEKWQNPKRVLRERAKREAKMAVLKLPRAGEWRKPQGEGAETADEESTEALKKLGPRVTRKVEKYLDVLKRDADPMELLDKVFDNELKSITGREVIVYSDLLQKLLFKNMVPFTKVELPASEE